MSTVALDPAAVRARFSALRRPLAFFDGPGGTQVPDEVIDAIAGYLRESNANLGGAFTTSRRSGEVVSDARAAAARFLGCSAEEVVFGANMTTLNFTLSRTLGRELAAGRRDRRDEARPRRQRLALARAGAGPRVASCSSCEIATTRRSTSTHLESLLSERTRVVAFPWASNAVGTLVDSGARVGARARGRRARLGRRRPLRAARADRRGRCRRRRPRSARRTSSSGRTSGSRSPGRSCSSAGGRTRCAPRRTAARARASRPARCRTSCSAGFVAAVEYVESVGFEVIVRVRAGARRALPRRPPGQLHAATASPTMDGRVPTFCGHVRGLTPDMAAERLAERGFATWSGNYYAVEVMERLGLPDGAAADRHRPLQHRRRGRPPARRARRALASRRPREPRFQRGSSVRIRSGSTPRASARSSVRSWKRTMSTTGCTVGTSVVSQPSSRERRGRAGRALGRPSLAFEHERAHRLVDRGEVPVQKLLGLVRLGRDVGAFAQLQHGLLRRRPVAPGAGDEEALVPRRPAHAARARAPRPRAARRCRRRAAQRARRPRTCSSRCGTSSARSRASRRPPRRRARRAGSRACR